MTGRDLLNALQQLPPDVLDHEVSTEGCDCDGDVARVTVRADSLYLERSPARRR